MMSGADEQKNPLQYYLDTVAGEISNLEDRCRVYGDQSGSDGRAFEYYPEVHGEVRMALTHISRAEIGLCVGNGKRLEELLSEMIVSDRVSLENLVQELRASSQDGNDKEMQRQIDGASGHLLRAEMDARKGQYEMIEKTIRPKFEKYLGYGIHGIKNGELIAEYEQRKQGAERYYERAKLAETLGHHGVASRQYEKSRNEIDAASNLLEQYQESIEKAGQDRLAKRFKVTVKAVVSIAGFVVFCVALICTACGALF